MRAKIVDRKVAFRGAEYGDQPPVDGKCLPATFGDRSFFCYVEGLDLVYTEAERLSTLRKSMEVDEIKAEVASHPVEDSVRWMAGIHDPCERELVADAIYKKLYERSNGLS